MLDCEHIHPLVQISGIYLPIYKHLDSVFT